MSEVKFSGGPWTVGDTDVYCEVYDSNGISIANTCATSCDGDYETGLANANLISAAPEMYDFIENMKSYLNECCKDAKNKNHMIAAIDDLLAKARGESC